MDTIYRVPTKILSMQDKLFRQAALEKLSSPEELDQLMQVTTPRGWFALIALIGLVVVAIGFALFSVIPVRAEASYCVLTKDPTTENISAVLYVPYRTNELHIQTGDETHISIAGSNGFVLGKVQSAGDFPVNDADMLAVLGSSSLVNQLLNDNGSLIEVHVDPLPDETAPGNYQWSTGQSAPISMQSKLRCDASITIDQKHPIQLILRGS